ncbi:hypothetical protein BDW75DRAFT_221846 [Aspergillus navahoensis]
MPVVTRSRARAKRASNAVATPVTPQQSKFVKPSKAISLQKQLEELFRKNASVQDFDRCLAKNNNHLSFHPPLDFDNIFRRDAWYLSVENKRLDVLALLLKRENKYQWNCLHVAVVYDKLGLVEELASKIPQYGHETDLKGCAALHLAFEKANAKIVHYLLRNGCWNEYKGNDQGLLAHKVVESAAWDSKKSTTDEWIALLDWLLEIGKFKPGMRDENDMTRV